MSFTDTVYRRQLTQSLIGYGVSVCVSGLIVDYTPGTAWWRPIVAVLPMLPAGLVLLRFVQHFERMDELQQRIHLLGLAFSFGGTAFITFTYGFMELAGFPRVSAFWVWPVMAALWGIGQARAGRAYR